MLTTLGAECCQACGTTKEAHSVIPADRRVHRTAGNSKAPISTMAAPSPSPSQILKAPSRSNVGRFGALLSPASMTGEPGRTKYRPSCGAKKSGSSEILPLNPLWSVQIPPYAGPNGLKTSLNLKIGGLRPLKSRQKTAV